MFQKRLNLIFLITITAYIQKSIASTDQNKLIVYQSPSYHVYDFSDNSKLKLSEFKDLLLAVNGFSLSNPIQWKGLKSTSPVQSPKAIVLFLVNSNSVGQNFLSKKFIPVEMDTTANFEYLKNFFDSGNSFKEFDKLPLNSNELETDFKNLKDDCASSSVFYVFKAFDSDAKSFDDSINKITEKFNQTCVDDKSNNLAIYILVTDSIHLAKRDANTVKESTNSISSVAIFYSDQYPAMFNLLFWTSLILGLAIIAIAYGMCNMDPGLDTVIYRMTSQRIKKDQ